MIKRREMLFGGGLLALALIIRLIFAAQLVFPPLDDPAFYVQTARNVVAGRGLVIDVIYNYWVPFASVTHPSHEYWMPITSLMMAAFMRLGGDSLVMAQLPGVLAGALWPVLTYIGGLSLMAHRRWSLIAALMVLLGAVPVYQATAADSMGLFTALSASTMLIGAAAIDRTRRGMADRRTWVLTGLAGLLCGLSYLTRSHGSLLPIALALVGLLTLRAQRATLARMMLIGGLAYFIVVVPWWLRNTAVFGTAQPIPLLSLAATTDNNQWYNVGGGPSLAALDWTQVLGVRVTAIWQLLGVIALLTLPYGLIGLPIAVTQRQTSYRVFSLYAGLLFVVGAVILPASGLSGSFYHSAGVFTIWAAIGAADGLRRWFDRPRRRVWSVAALASIFSLIIAQGALAWPGLIADSQSNLIKFDEVTSWLRENVPPDQPIITNEAHSLNYASGYPTLTLPNQQDVVTLRQLADRYGVHHVVVFGSIGLYPEALNEPAAKARLAATWPNVVVYELLPQ